MMFIHRVKVFQTGIKSAANNIFWNIVATLRDAGCYPCNRNISIRQTEKQQLYLITKLLPLPNFVEV